MQSIRDWMEANPDQAKDVRRANKSYVFFRITDLATEDEAVGAEGVPLMPGRSIAVDHSLHTYGMPFFIAADLPIAAEKAATKFDSACRRARYRLGDRRPGARRYLFRRRRRSRAHRRAHQKSGRLLHAAAARARSGRSRARHAACRPSARARSVFATSTMEDPTVPDSATAQDVPLPEPKPSTAPTGKRFTGKPKAKTRQKK